MASGLNISALLCEEWVKQFLFSLKSTTNWSLRIKGGIQGIFVVTEKTLQYGVVTFRIDFMTYEL